MDRKVTEEEFFRGAAYLREAGFAPKDTGAYLLAGLPGQTLRITSYNVCYTKLLREDDNSRLGRLLAATGRLSVRWSRPLVLLFTALVVISVWGRNNFV